MRVLAIVELGLNVRTEDGKLRYGAAETARAPLERLLCKGQQEGEFRGFDVRVMAGTIHHGGKPSPTKQ
jgi:TetR/AcrR family transcriptional regulator, fatty acid metabolism regulator protein